MLAVLANVATAGCDYVFRIDHVDVAHDAPPLAIDARRDSQMLAIDAPESCPGNYMQVDETPASSYYRWVTAPTTWDLAEFDCENDSVTDITHLAVLDDVGEMTAVRAWIGTQTSDSFVSLLGYARDTGSDPMQFYAVTGAPVAKTQPPWNQTEPDNGGPMGNEETIVWFSHQDNLIDGPWTYSQMYVCECDHQRVTKQFTLH